MKPGKVGAPGDETNIVDDFGSEERVLEPLAEPYSSSQAAIKIVIPDELTQPSEMFPPEPRQPGAAQRATVLDFDGPVIQPPARATAATTAGAVSTTGLRLPRSILRSVGAVGMVAVSIVLGAIGGATLRNRLDLSVLSEYLEVVRTRTRALREVLPTVEVVRDSAVSGSTTRTTDNPPATVATTNSVTAGKKIENVKVEASRPRQTTTSPPPTRAAPPSPRPPASSALIRAAASPPTRPVRPVMERAEPALVPAPAVNASTSSPAVPTVSSAATMPALNPVPLAPVTSAAPPSAPSPALPPPALAAPSAPPAGALTAETRGVALALNRYQDAFSALDANAAHAVWPSVDVKALAKAFDQLEEQTFDLEGCDITVTGARAEAECAGNARYVRKVGNRTLRVEPRRWHFTLRQSSDQWIIDAVDAR